MVEDVYSKAVEEHVHRDEEQRCDVLREEQVREQEREQGVHSVLEVVHGEYDRTEGIQ